MLYSFFLSLSYSLPVSVLPEHEKKFTNMNGEFLEALEVRDQCAIWMLGELPLVPCP